MEGLKHEGRDGDRLKLYVRRNYLESIMESGFERGQTRGRRVSRWSRSQVMKAWIKAVAVGGDKAVGSASLED